MRIIACVATVFLVACTSPTPTVTHYLLPADVPEGTRRVDAPVLVGIANVTVAPYLSRPGLAVETDERQVRNARAHVWAEPLAEGIRRQLRAGVSSALGFDVSADPTQRRRWDWVVDVAIERLHGNLEGQAVLVARWRISPRLPSREVATYRQSRSQPLQRAGYAGLVDAEVALIDDLAREIAASLATLTGDSSS